ncbi:hypothetical protein FO441_07495 [Salinicoccus cyprini]|uniref:ZIP Zinc transporter n=1 Tax=Salinicoccus cyprini TaxID=2493691 RepID=A0A558AVF6_9STAP|nr:hypothetical protein [Salinicoccus cyprini]TVT28248.1 hypothetical protein FO441_07495 [Salinicoccus cyprini]
MGIWFSLIFAIGFVIIHLLSKQMKFLRVDPRSKFLSIAGGISVAYVFMHLLPELGEYQQEFEGAIEGLEFLESHIYIIALLGLVIFYGLEQLAKKSRKRGAEKGTDKASSGVFWLHISSFALYNAIIGYLLLRGEYQSEWGMLLYFFAMGIHFITNDKALRSAHKDDYDRYGRWLLAVAITIGWFVGVFTELNILVISVLTAFLAGGVILNVMKEELPEERESSFPAFFSGMLGYTVLLLFL